MATNTSFLAGLRDKFKNGLTTFQNAMLGTPVQGMQPESSVNYSYPEQLQTYLNDLPNQDYAKGLFNQPKETQLSREQINTGIANGLNYGIPEIAQKQKELGINIPQTGEDIYNAQLGEFNHYAPTIQTGIANEPRQGGILRDIAAGARENYNQGFNVDNWGQKKNAATRVGEFLGSVARFADSAPGRGLIAGGLIGALGGSPTEMAAYGLSAGVGRQQKRMQDQLYRNQLEEQGIDTSNITGMVDKDTFNSIGNMQNRVLNTALKQQATESMNKLRELQAEKLRIENSNLPEMQKYKLLQEKAKAIHAEEIQLAKIQYYANSAALGWANFGLRVSADERAKIKDKRQAEKEANEQKVLDELLGGGTGSPKTTTKKDSLGIL